MVYFTDISGAPTHGSLIKVCTNIGLVGLVEVRYSVDKTYDLMLKSQIIGEIPRNEDEIGTRYFLALNGISIN